MFFRQTGINVLFSLQHRLSALNQILELLSSSDKGSKDKTEKESAEKVIPSTMLLSCVSMLVLLAFFLYFLPTQ
jgi:hypothetical protein